MLLTFSINQRNLMLRKRALNRQQTRKRISSKNRGLKEINTIRFSRNSNNKIRYMRSRVEASTLLTISYSNKNFKIKGLLKDNHPLTNHPLTNLLLVFRINLQLKKVLSMGILRKKKEPNLPLKTNITLTQFNNPHQNNNMKIT